MAHLRHLFRTLPRYEPTRDFTVEVMARIEATEQARTLRRTLLAISGLSAAAFGLVGYRWYTFFALRDYSSVMETVLGHVSHISGLLTFGYWSEGFRLVRTSLPMVETTLAMVVMAMVAMLVWKYKALWRGMNYTPTPRGDAH